MDIIRFTNNTSQTKLEDAEIVNGLTSKMWIERYRAAGEFTLTAAASSGMRQKLPIGSLISHIDSTEVMIVEDHKISEKRGTEPELVITGRGFETIFEQRIVGGNKNYAVNSPPADYVLAANPTWDQAVALISDHILAAHLIDATNAIPYVEVQSDVDGVSTGAAMSIRKDDLYKALLALLEIDDLGVKVIRPGLWSPLALGNPNILVQIHKGVDRASDVIFSNDDGGIESADYLWSNKLLKNAAIVSSKWTEIFVSTTAYNYDRRIMPVDASALDNALAAAPTGTDLANLRAAMQQWGLTALAAQKDISLTQAEISKNYNKTRYRVDFDVGDIVTVNADYNETSAMRISEYVEMEDQTGASAYPTLVTI